MLAKTLKSMRRAKVKNAIRGHANAREVRNIKVKDLVVLENFAFREEGYETHVKYTALKEKMKLLSDQEAIASKIPSALAASCHNDEKNAARSYCYIMKDRDEKSYLKSSGEMLLGSFFLESMSPRWYYEPHVIAASAMNSVSALLSKSKTGLDFRFKLVGRTQFVSLVCMNSTFVETQTLSPTYSKEFHNSLLLNFVHNHLIPVNKLLCRTKNALDDMQEANKAQLLEGWWSILENAAPSRSVEFDGMLKVYTKNSQAKLSEEDVLKSFYKSDIFDLLNQIYCVAANMESNNLKADIRLAVMPRMWRVLNDVVSISDNIDISHRDLYCLITGLSVIAAGSEKYGMARIDVERLAAHFSEILDAAQAEKKASSQQKWWAPFS